MNIDEIGIVYVLIVIVVIIATIATIVSNNTNMFNSNDEDNDVEDKVSHNFLNDNVTVTLRKYSDSKYTITMHFYSNDIFNISISQDFTYSKTFFNMSTEKVIIEFRETNNCYIIVNINDETYSLKIEE